MIKEYKVHVDLRLLGELKKLSRPKQRMLHNLFFRYSRGLLILSVVRGLFRYQFLVNTLMTFIMLIGVDMLSGQHLSGGWPQAPWVFLSAGVLFSIIRTVRGVQIQASPYVESVSPLHRADGNLLFVIFFKNSFNGDVYTKEVWTGERGFWEELQRYIE